MTGADSTFDITTRDALPSPAIGPGQPGTNSSLDALYLNNAQDALYRLEAWTMPVVRLEDGSSASPALSAAVQRWMVSYAGGDTRGNAFTVILPISPAFLEDAGVVPTQDKDPYNAKVSLAASLSLASPPFVPYVVEGAAQDYSLAGGLLLPVQPPWASQLSGSRLLTFSVRLIGATGDQCVGLEDVVFFDAGSGTSPKMMGNVRFSTPDKRTTTLPSGSYEIGLCAMNWIQ